MRNRQGCNFGNAREARNLFDNVKRVMAERVDTNAALEDDFTFVFRSDVKKAIDMSIEALCTVTLHNDSDGNDEKDIPNTLNKRTLKMKNRYWSSCTNLESRDVKNPTIYL